MIIRLIICLIGSYLLGCINAAYIYSKRFKHTDIRKYGSGNAGSTNVLRVFGFSPAIVVFAFDLLKGLAAVTLTSLIVPDFEYATLLSAVCVVAGHNWPIFLDYRGGKGVATSIGIIFALDWRVAVICFIVGLLLIIITKMVSVGTVTGITLSFIVALILNLPLSRVIIFLMLALFCIFQHRGNIKRIINGTENKLDFSEKKK